MATPVLLALPVAASRQLANGVIGIPIDRTPIGRPHSCLVALTHLGLVTAIPARLDGAVGDDRHAEPDEKFYEI